MRTTSRVLEELHQALEVPIQPGAPLGTWRWTVRQRMAGVRDALVAETAHHEDAWLAARGGSVLRERNALLGRLSALGPQVLEEERIEQVRGELARLLCDIRHHVQRLHDLAYDEVELELGGSE
ncbi:hypothetical protein [Nocardioides sp.]|uniref:hypothetical protein n=1 Tax=Nocardioides sp. TaxID=35761 RepID=UPI003528F8B9